MRGRGVLYLQQSKVWVQTEATNLKNHLRACIGPNFEDIYLDIEIGCIWFHQSAGERGVYKSRNHPISEVDDEVTRDMLKNMPISSKTLRK